MGIYAESTCRCLVTVRRKLEKGKESRNYQVLRDSKGGILGIHSSLPP